jgi:hypothetical protein
MGQTESLICVSVEVHLVSMNSRSFGRNKIVGEISTNKS